jgi:quercetin dioxygenase-like cupin family protein
MNFRTITKAAAGTAFAAAFLTPAAATPPSGLGIFNIVNGQFGTLHVNSDKTENNWNLFLKTKADSDIGAQRITLEPQGTSGWHSHPAPIFLTVTKGTIEYTDSLLCTPQTLTAGQSIVEPAYRVNTIVNPASAGGEVAEMVGIVVKPTSVIGPAFRIDAQVPNNCE